MSDRLVRLFVVLVAVALVVVAVVVGPRILGGKGAAKIRPQLATASTRSFTVTVGGQGSAVPRDETAVDFPTSGTIATLAVQVGQSVAKGTVLATQSSTTAASNVAQAQAALQAAQAGLAAAEGPLDPATAAKLQAALSSAQQVASQTSTEVRDAATSDAAAVTADQQRVASAQQTADSACAGSGAGSGTCSADQATVSADQATLAADQSRQSEDAASGQVRLDQADAGVTSAQAAIIAASTPSTTSVASAKAAVATAQAKLQAAQAAQGDLTLTAPVAGTVLEVNGQVGLAEGGNATSGATLPGTSAPVPSTGAGSGSGQPLVVLGDPSDLVVAVPLATTAIGEVRVGQTGTITADIDGGLSIPCGVLALAASPTTVSGSQQFYVTVVPEGQTRGLVTGTDVQVSIDVSQVSNVLAVPQSAVYLLAGLPHVDVWTGKRAVPVTITTGSQGTQLVQITSGLQSGQQVVLSAYQGLPAGSSSSTSVP